jgi:hypothetical protein
MKKHIRFGQEIAIKRHPPKFRINKISLDQDILIYLINPLSNEHATHTLK